MQGKRLNFFAEQVSILVLHEVTRYWHLAHFNSNVTFLYPLKTSGKHRWSDIVREYRKVTLD